LKNRLDFYLESYCLVLGNLYGFHRDLDTMDYLDSFVDSVCQSFCGKGFLNVVFIDFKGAYDANVVPSLLKRLSHLVVSYT